MTLSDRDYRDSLYTDWVIDWLVVAEACRGAWAEIDGCLCRQLLLNWLQWPQLFLACDVAATAVIASFFRLPRSRGCSVCGRNVFCRATPYQRGTCCRLVSVCLSVRPSQAGIVPKRLDGQSWFFSELPLTYPELLVRKFGHLKNKGTSLWNFTPNAGLRKFRHGESMVWSTRLVDGRACGLCLRRSSESCLDAHSLLHVGRL